MAHEQQGRGGGVLAEHGHSRGVDRVSYCVVGAGVNTRGEKAAQFLSPRSAILVSGSVCTRGRGWRGQSSPPAPPPLVHFINFKASFLGMITEIPCVVPCSRQTLVRKLLNTMASTITNKCYRLRLCYTRYCGRYLMRICIVLLYLICIFGEKRQDKHILIIVSFAMRECAAVPIIIRCP